MVTLLTKLRHLPSDETVYVILSSNFTIKRKTNHINYVLYFNIKLYNYIYTIILYNTYIFILYFNIVFLIKYIIFKIRSIIIFIPLGHTLFCIEPIDWTKCCLDELLISKWFTQCAPSHAQYGSCRSIHSLETQSHY